MGKRPRVCCICGHRLQRFDSLGRQLCSLSCTKEYERREKEELARRPKDRGGRPPLSDAEKRKRRVARALAKIKDGAALSPDQQRRLRAEIAGCVREQLEEAHKQVMGTSETPWTNVQARVFTSFLNKIVPDAKAPTTPEADETKPLEELTREELESLAALHASTIAATAKDVTDEDH